MNQVCRSEPISFLRLERYLQGDAAEPERERVSMHLAQCEACRVCFAELQADVVELLPIPAEARVAAPRRWQLWAARLRGVWPQLTAAVIVAAAALLWQRPVGPDSGMTTRVPSARVAIKGGELALELVREHAGTLATDSARFVPGDRLQLRVSCPAGDTPYWDVLVFQDGRAAFPFQPTEPLVCANGITLPGAFLLDSASRAYVCVVIDAHAAPVRAQLHEPSQLAGMDSACVVLEPAR